MTPCWVLWDRSLAWLEGGAEASRHELSDIARGLGRGEGAASLANSWGQAIFASSGIKGIFDGPLLGNGSNEVFSVGTNVTRPGFKTRVSVGNIIA